MVERERFQLVIALGEGAEGQRLREAVDRAAQRAGKPISTWAREILLTAAGDAKNSVDPVAEVRLNGNEVTLLNLRAVAGMQNGFTNKVIGLLGGQWVDIGTKAPDELLERWKRVHRSGLVGE